MKKKKRILLFIMILFSIMDVCEAYTINENFSIKVSCGNGVGKITEIPYKIPELTNFAIDVIQVAVPIILIVMGAIDLFKGIVSSKEDEIKKGQQTFIKRLIIGGTIFFVIVIVKFIISIVASVSKNNIIDCIDCFVSDGCKEQAKEEQQKYEKAKEYFIDTANKISDFIIEDIPEYVKKFYKYISGK